MMWFQNLARLHTKKPVIMSSLCHLPAVTCAFNVSEKIAIFTANGETLAPMKGLIKDECGVEMGEDRYVIVGCQDVPGFEAVAAGEKVDVKAVTPGMVAKCKATLEAHPTIRGILMECTELPPYSDALRQAFGLPVFDSITCCDFFIDGVTDNPRFGLNDWHAKWDGKQETYTFGENLDKEDQEKVVNDIPPEQVDAAPSSEPPSRTEEVAAAEDAVVVGDAAAVAIETRPPKVPPTKTMVNRFVEMQDRARAAHASLGVIRALPVA